MNIIVISLNNNSLSYVNLLHFFSIIEAVGGGSRPAMVDDISSGCLSCFDTLSVNFLSNFLYISSTDEHKDTIYV